MPEIFRYETEQRQIRFYDRAAAVGKLMLGQFNSWQQFLEPETNDLKNIPRRDLKELSKDANKRLSKEIKKFCDQNFIGMNAQILNELYELIKSLRGIEIPLSEFEAKFAKANPKIYQGNPQHLTLCISLWGLQFRYPEDEITKDLIEALKILGQSADSLAERKHKTHADLILERDVIGSWNRQLSFASRSILLNSFNLLEAYLNGLAWAYAKSNDLSSLSNNDKKLLLDHSSNSLRDKVMKYPRIISGIELWKPDDETFEQLLGNLKPFRDSMVHASKHFMT